MSNTFEFGGDNTSIVFKKSNSYKKHELTEFKNKQSPLN